jgi:hypothetical protein
VATTTGALAQISLNIATNLKASIGQGSYNDLYDAVTDLATAVVALADAYYATLNAAATPSLTTSVAITPVIGGQYAAVTTGANPTTWPAPVVTGIR